MLNLILTRLIPGLFTLLCVGLIMNNINTPITLALTEQQHITLPLGGLIAAMYLLGIFAVVFVTLGLKNKLINQVKQQELRREQAQVSSETASDQIRALEAKVSTLEKALEKALTR